MRVTRLLVLQCASSVHSRTPTLLQESAFDDGPLRGALVLVGGETKSQWGQMHMFGFDDDGQVRGP